MAATEDAEFHQRVARLDGLLQEIETYADPAMRAKAIDAVQTLMEFHRAGLSKVLEYIADAGDGGQPILNRLAADDLVSSLLLIYDLHPADVNVRVNRALEKIRVALKSLGATFDLISFTSPNIKLRIERGGHSCGSTSGKIRSAIEEILAEKAPEVTGIELEGLEPAAGSSGFVPLEQLVGHRVSHVKSGENHDVDGAPIPIDGKRVDAADLRGRFGDGAAPIPAAKAQPRAV